MGGHNAHIVESFPTGRVNWTTGMALSTARAEVVERDGSMPSRRAAAFARAMHTARQRLVATLIQVPLDTERTVGGVLRDSIQKRGILEELVAGAEVVQTRYLPRDVVETTLQVPMFGRFASLVWPPPSALSASEHEASGAVYTGIIIDARGLAIRQALFPRIVDEEGQTLYAPTRVDVDVAIQRGYMVYARVLNSSEVTSRVGKHPFIIRARRVIGHARVDVLIRQADATQLQRFAALRHLLEQCQVVIVG
jgi:hypothetical protein